MILLENQASLVDLHSLIDKVKSYPITAAELIELAKASGAPKEVIRFYKAFPKDQVFGSKEDLITRTENLEIMHRENPPPEILLAPED